MPALTRLMHASHDLLALHLYRLDLCASRTVGNMAAAEKIRTLA